jgi:hypothetical protein
MKFFVVSTEDRGVIDCTTGIRAAHKSGRGTSPDGDYTVDEITVTLPPTEAIRRLLGNLGGYASDTARVYPRE